MDQFEHKTIITKPFDLTYSYYISPGFHSRLHESTPTLLLVHGFPDDAHMWAGAIPALLKLPYPIIIPDLLGFGASSKPADASKYNYRQQAGSIAHILDKESVPNNVIPVGHDWGSATSQRFYLYHRDRCVGLSLISLAYQVPSVEPFALDKVNEQTAQRFGYPQWEYWHWFTAPDAPKLMEENLARFWEVNNGNFPSDIPGEEGRDIWMRKMFCTKNAMREYITGTGEYAGYTVDLKPYARDPELKRSFIERLSRSGMQGPVNYYHSLANNTMLDEEKPLAESEELKKISVPVLYIGQTGDWVCRTDLMSDAASQGLVPDLEEHVVDAGHWVLYEKPEEIARILQGWLLKRFPVKS